MYICMYVCMYVCIYIYIYYIYIYIYICIFIYACLNPIAYVGEWVYGGCPNRDFSCALDTISPCNKSGVCVCVCVCV